MRASQHALRLPTSDLLPQQASLKGADAATLLCVYAVALLVIPARLVLRGVPLSLTPAQVIALAFALWWLCAQSTTMLGTGKGRNPVRTAVFLFVIAMLATYGYATYGYLPADELRLADHAAILVVAMVGLVLCVCDGVRTRERLDLVLKTVVVAGAAVSVVGALQFVLDIDLTRFLELPVLRFTAEYGFMTERASFRRVGATMAHPIEFGVVCAMILPLAVHFGFRARERHEPARRWWFCSFLIAAGLMFSVSRSAVLGLAGVALVLFVGWPGGRRLYAVLFSFGFLVFIKLTVPGLLGTFRGLFTNLGNDESILYRTHDYATAAAEISKHPWLGRGMGTWYAPKHQVFDNQYILTLVETGAIGLFVFVLIFLCAIYAALRARHLSTDAGIRDLGLTLTACLAVTLIASATFDLLAFQAVTGLTMLLVGASGALLRAAQQERTQQRNHPSAHPRTGELRP